MVRAISRSPRTVTVAPVTTPRRSRRGARPVAERRRGRAERGDRDTDARPLEIRHHFLVRGVVTERQRVHRQHAGPRRAGGAVRRERERNLHADIGPRELDDPARRGVILVEAARDCVGVDPVTRNHAPAEGVNVILGIRRRRERAADHLTRKVDLGPGLAEGERAGAEPWTCRARYRASGDLLSRGGVGAVNRRQRIRRQPGREHRRGCVVEVEHAEHRLEQLVERVDRGEGARGRRGEP